MVGELIIGLIGIGTATITAVVGPIVVEYVKTKIAIKKKSDNLLEETFVYDSLITDRLEEIKDHFDVDRMWMIQFHNGGHFYPTGKSIQKFSMVQERLKEGLQPCMYMFQGIPVSMCSKTINKLYDGQHVSNKSDSGSSYKFGITTISDSTIEESYMFSVNTIDGAFVAVVGLDFKEMKGFTETQLLEIDAQVAVIGGVLSNYLKK